MVCFLFHLLFFFFACLPINSLDCGFLLLLYIYIYIYIAAPEELEGRVRKPRFTGLTTAEISKIPHVQDWLNDKNSLALAMASREVQAFSCISKNTYTSNFSPLTHLLSLSLSVIYISILKQQVVEQIEANLKNPKSPQKVNTKDARKALKDMSSAVGNYFGFWHKYKGTHSLSSFLHSQTNKFLC